MRTYQLTHQKTCMLTLDLENDCGGRVGTIFDAINETNLQRLLDFIDGQNIPVTFFVTGKIFEEKEEELRLIQRRLKRIEFALHSYSHPNPPDLCSDYSEEIRKGAEAYKQFTGQEPWGYRSPLGNISKKDFECLKKYGFRYDSSIFPTIRPGLFNHLNMPKTPFYMDEFDLLEIPSSVFPLINLPMGLGYMRLLGPTLTKVFFMHFPLPPIIVMGFHLHDVIQTPHTERLRAFWKFFYRKNVTHGFSMLECIITTLQKKGYEFTLMKDISPLLGVK